jgi:hypothetical protein
MNRIVTALTLATTMAFAPALTPVAEAKPKDGSSVQIPVAGVVSGAAENSAKFAGTFTVQRFVNDNGTIVAVGTIAGTVTDPAGNVVRSGLQTVAIPVTATQVADPALAAITAAAVCPVLHLDLGPLNLNLLGLQVDLSRVVLDITAISGAGNLLGNLLCAVTGLLDSPTGLAAILNQILGILGGL